MGTRDNWFPYNFYCCSSDGTVALDSIIGFLIISTVVAGKGDFKVPEDNWFPYNFYCCSVWKSTIYFSG